MEGFDGITLESFVDSYSLNGVLSELERICYSKAEHLEANWQDRTMAKRWAAAAKKVGSLILTKSITDAGT